MRDNCPVCESQKISKFLSHSNVPVHQNFLIDEKESAINITKGELNLVVCTDCGFIFNQTFDPSRLSYGIKYDNTQDYSPSFSEYISKLVDHMINGKKIRNCKIIEIGCGKGLFLRKLVESEDSGNSGTGFDPSYTGPDSDMEGRIKFERRYFDESCSTIPADVVVWRHVIEHIAEPVSLLRMVRQSLKNSPSTRVFFETPSVEWILKNKVVWDFFYEHCSYFTPQSLRTAFEIAGFQIEEVKSVFGGQYLWLEATISDKEQKITKDSGSIPFLAKQFSIDENNIKERWEARIHELSSVGKVALWGAGAKGVTFANMIDPKAVLIDSIIDLNPKKCGKYVPGTGHVIISYKDIPRRRITSVILMNPNYRDEVISLLDESELNVKIIIE